MGRLIGNENNDEISPHNTHYHMIDSNTLTFPRMSQSNTTTSDLNDLSSLSPKAILKSQQQGINGDKHVTMHSQAEIIQLHSNTPSLNGLSNPCYFTAYNDTIDQYDIDQQHLDNRVVISIRGGGQNNNNNNNTEAEIEDTKF
jgi:hypothetical protein